MLASFEPILEVAKVPDANANADANPNPNWLASPWEQVADLLATTETAAAETIQGALQGSEARVTVPASLAQAQNSAAATIQAGLTLTPTLTLILTLALTLIGRLPSRGGWRCTRLA